MHTNNLEQTKEIKELNEKKLIEKMKGSTNSFLINYKIDLAEAIATTYFNWKKNENMDQKKFAKIIQCTQPRVSNIINGNIDNFTIDRLITFCLLLGIKPTSHVKPLKKMKTETRKQLQLLSDS